MLKRGVTAAAVLAGAIFFALSGCSFSSGGAASCAAPSASVQPTTLTAGGTFALDGDLFHSDCFDTGQDGIEPPLADIPVMLMSSGSPTDGMLLGKIDADDSQKVHATLSVPTGFPLGPATLKVGDAAPIDVTIVAGPS